jgi:hypothetical protein
MKNNLILKKYKVINDYGTKNMKSSKSFFGSSLINIENTILIDNITLSYSDINGYQNYHKDNKEIMKFLDLTNLKKDNHSIYFQNQTPDELIINTHWEIKIKIKKILKEYLFFKIKKSKTFKSIKKNQTLNNDIDNSIYLFIENNILNRYKFSNVYLYVKYQPIMIFNTFNPNLLQYTPDFKDEIYDNDNLINDYNLKNHHFNDLEDVTINYNQIKNSDEYKIEYYFNIEYKKI